MPEINEKVSGISEPGAQVEVVRVEAEPTPEEKAQCKAWLETLKVECENHRDLWKNMRAWREAAAGMSEYAVNLNLHQATLETLLPILYAQNPEIEVDPQESVGDDRYAVLQPVCDTLEIVANRQLRDGGLKRVCERAIRAAKVCGYGVVKVMFQQDTDENPVVVSRINDIQDNLRRIASMTESIAEGGGSAEDIEKERADLQDSLKALQDHVEVVKALGVVLDFVRSDDWLIPYSVGEMIDYQQAPWQAQRIWMAKDEAVARFALSKDDAAMATTYSDRHAAPDDGAKDKDHKRDAELVCCWEVWDHKNQMVYTMLEGIDHYVKSPFAPSYVGERFYPYFLLAFAWVDGRREPLSAVAMADPLVREYNGVRSGYKEHRERAIPAGVFDKSIMDVEDVERLQKRDRIELVGIDANGANVQTALGMVQYPPVDPGLYNTEVIRGELDIIYGVQDAMRGVVMTAKTATEAQIMQQGLGARTQGQRSSLESWLQDIAQFTVEVLLLAMPPQQALRIAGPQAQWPQMNREQVYDFVQVSILAGSTGKPNQQKDMEAWAQLLPQIMPLIQQYARAQQQGMMGVADALGAIVRETFRRFDEHIDVDQFLPKLAAGQQMGMQQAAPPTTQPEMVNQQ